MQESHPTHMQSHDDYGIYMHINTTKSHHFMALLYGMTPWQITFHDFQMTWIHLHSLPLGRPSTRDESATSLVQWWNPTSSGRYPPSDDWHHPIQRLEPAFFPQKCQDVLYRISKNMEMPWMVSKVQALRSDFNMTLVPGCKSLESTKFRSCASRFCPSISLDFPVDSRIPLAVLRMAALRSTSWWTKWLLKIGSRKMSELSLTMKYDKYNEL